ncbi:MAG: hypothetical protein DCC67_20245 [Planctomycetota bacterium]|nr:MAG: hypothetical protein DCC67_20245 [Planctomycetota bacterium]
MLLAITAAFALVSTAEASILASFVRKGTLSAPILNTLNDTNAEVITKGAGNVAAAFEVGDSVTLYLQFNEITTSDGFFLNEDLDDASAGGPGYNLLGKGTFTITAIGDLAGVGSATNDDISFTGSIKIYESASSLSFGAGIAAADAVIAAASEIAEIGIAPGSDDFITAVDAPTSFASIPSSPATAVQTDLGLSLLSGGAGLEIIDEALTSPYGTTHAIVGDSGAYRVSPVTLGDDVFDLVTDTTIGFQAGVPEPSTIVVWGTLASAVAAYGAHRRRRSA